MTGAGVDRSELQRDASRALRAGDPAGALVALWRLIDRSQLPDGEFARQLLLLAEAYRAQGSTRAAGSIALFLGRTVDARRLAANQPRDLARTAALEGRRVEAAEHFRRAHWLGHAAFQLEEAGDLRGARLLWEELLDRRHLGNDPYTAGLVAFNLSRICEALGDGRAGRNALVRCTHLLEAAADGFEAAGLRERAFDCFQVLLSLGKAGAFENLAEGYLNCIRILKEDNLRNYVVQYYEDFQRLAIERNELHAAATLYREAADYARRHGMPYEARYRWQAAATHARAGEAAMTAGQVDLAENAFAAAIAGWNEIGAFAAVRGAYGRLIELPLPEKQRDRFALIMNRLQDAKNTPATIVPFPDYLRMDAAYPDVWRLDVLEWEHAGDAAEVMAEVMVNESWPAFTRRRALLCRLRALGHGNLSIGGSAADEATASGTGAAATRIDATREADMAALATDLGNVEIFASLAALEHLFAIGSSSVRVAVVRALAKLFFKRSFVTLGRALDDAEPTVRDAALETLSSLHFPHAFDPLSRIYQQTATTAVRRAALGAIGRINTVESLAFLIEVLQQGDATERELAVTLLARHDHGQTSNHLREAAVQAAGPLRQRIDAALRARGGR